MGRHHSCHISGLPSESNLTLRMGQTAQASGTEMRASGQSQSVTSGWLSDAPAVATVTGAGLVTGVANGRATIYAVAGGRQGQQVIRVCPTIRAGGVAGFA